MQDNDVQPRGLTRRRVLGAMGIASLALMSSRASAQQTVDLHVPGGPSTRTITTSYPQKGRMIMQRSSPPWLEAPFEVFTRMPDTTVELVARSRQPVVAEGGLAILPQATFDEAQNADLLDHYLRILSEAKPRAFLLENVFGLAYKNHNAFWLRRFSVFSQRQRTSA